VFILDRRGLLSVYQDMLQFTTQYGPHIKISTLTEGQIEDAEYKTVRSRIFLVDILFSLPIPGRKTLSKLLVVGLRCHHAVSLLREQTVSGKRQTEKKRERLKDCIRNYKPWLWGRKKDLKK